MPTDSTAPLDAPTAPGAPAPRTANGRRSFASDNNAGVHPAVLQAIAEANVGHVRGYGDDPHTTAALAAFRAQFGARVHVYLVFNGTGANVLGLASAMYPHEAVICSEHAHLHVDECGAPERFIGGKLLTVSAPHGKITPDAVATQLRGVGDPHHVQPRVISIAQASEYGTVYTVAEVRALAAYAHAQGMYLHMDGARLANAAAALGVSLAALSGEAGVDVLSFGGTKNGMLGGEAVVIFAPALAAQFEYRRKQGMQLASKMRFIAAQFTALLSDDLWRRNAAHANAMAARLAAGIRPIPGVKITQPVDANAVFAVLPPAVIPRLREAYDFYVWNEAVSEVRLMASFDTTEEDVDGFVERLSTLL